MTVRPQLSTEPFFKRGKVTYFNTDCFEWLERRKTHSIHGVVTDPPFALEYSAREQAMKLNGNRGGVWRLPPAWDSYTRTPVPRFTVLSKRDIETIEGFFSDWAERLLRPLVPGAHVLVASTPMLSHAVAAAIEEAGFQRRGEIIRLVKTMRGGDRPKYAHEEFPEVSVIPRGMYEPWLLFRKPFEGRIHDNLRRWGTGGLRRPDEHRPFGDVIQSTIAPQRERAVAPHASLKPQAFLRQVVRAILPLGRGVVLDPFAGSGSTLAAAAAVGYRAIGIERDLATATMAVTAIPALRAIDPRLAVGVSNGIVRAGSTGTVHNGNGRAVAKTNGRGKDPRPLAT